MDIKSELRKLENQMAERDRSHENARVLGDEFADKHIELDLSYKADALSEILYKWFNHQESIGQHCGSLLVEWMFERFYGKIVEDYYVKAFHYRDKLNEISATYKDPFVWNDLDYLAWVENDVLVFENRAGAIPFYLYIINDLYFHARTCERFVKRNSLNLAGWAGIDVPSLKFYRDNKFQVRYGDCRDVGYCFTYDPLLHKVDRAGSYLASIHGALFNLDALGDELMSVENYGK